MTATGAPLSVDTVQLDDATVAFREGPVEGREDRDLDLGGVRFDLRRHTVAS